VSRPVILYSRYQLIQMGWSTTSVKALLAEHSREHTTEGSQTTVYYRAEEAIRIMRASDAWLSANYMPGQSERYWPQAVRAGRQAEEGAT